LEPVLHVHYLRDVSVNWVFVVIFLSTFSLEYD
jgi:hypothetical protein